MERAFHRHLLEEKMFILALRMLSALRERGTFHCVRSKSKDSSNVSKTWGFSGSTFIIICLKKIF